MSYLPALPVRYAPSGAYAGASRRGPWRSLLIGVGLILIAFGFVIAPLPGPLGVPFTLAGLMLVLRNSYRARRLFVRLQRRHPRWVSPMRRLLRRNPPVAQIAWQQVLRIERLVTPGALRRHRLAQRLRRGFRR